MISDSMFYAKRDGIESKEILYHNRRCHRFMIPCAKCGEIMAKATYKPELVYLCPYCRRSQEEKKKAVFEDAYAEIRSKKEQQFDKAVELLHARIPGGNFDKSIALAEQRVELYGSIPEAVTAIMLLQEGYKIIPQQKVRNLTVDFCIPADKIVVEVDGSLYHTDKAKSLQRDLRIQMALGMDWEVIHLPAEGVIQKPSKVCEGIRAILQHRGK